MKTTVFTKQTIQRLTCAWLCALTLTTVGCSQEEENVPEGNEKHITATAAISEDGPKTRIIYNGSLPQWTPNDFIGVWKADESTVNVFTRTDGENGNSKTAEFEGKVSCEEGDLLCAVYPCPTKVEIGNKISIDLSAQTGGYEGEDKRLHYMYAQAKQENGAVTFQFQHAVAMLRLTWTAGIKPTSLTFSAKGLHNKGLLNVSKGLTTEKEEGSIVVTGNFNMGNVIFYLFEENLTEVKVEASDGTHTYAGTMTDRYLAAGWLYEAKVELTQVN